MHDEMDNKLWGAYYRAPQKGTGRRRGDKHPRDILTVCSYF